MIRQFLVACCLSGLATLARAKAPAPLADAMNTGFGDSDSWAYIETTMTVDDKGRASKAKIVRFDPSKPYADQFTPILIDGKPPTAKQLQDYRKRGEKRGERLAKKADAKSAPDDGKTRIGINKKGAVVDFEDATLLSDDGKSLVYLVPLVAEGSGSLPVDNLRLTLQVGKRSHALEHASLRLVSPLRLMLVVKVKQGELSADWTVVDPKYPPVLTAVHGQGLVSLAFVKLGGSVSTERAEFKRVTPYGNRFGVKIGPLKTLPF